MMVQMKKIQFKNEMNDKNNTHKEEPITEKDDNSIGQSSSEERKSSNFQKAKSSTQVIS